ncbi:rhomboid family intramembrane serine protease [Amylibacter ulvae]|uniref:Rhomboid family intramembrane serine protease n=2 Tax=Paramylibacter ulvae TaxID=1651968 RepID=A0ABQ3CY00_9RHOB|nr:rhomboid family intramembrane serine protease [Amylibacter ulvae]
MAGMTPNNPPRRILSWADTPKTLIYTIMITITLIELVLQISDRGWIADGQLRGLAYKYGAFWSKLTDDWRPIYAAQPWTMFFTYAFLHGGLFHLIGNVVTLGSLGAIALQRMNQWKFLQLYLAGMLGGAVMFAALSDSAIPMIGASGAIFGLVGAWQYWEFANLRRRKLPLTPFYRMMVNLVILNLLFWYMLQGALAWETHLGGFVAGWLWAYLFARD